MTADAGDSTDRPRSNNSRRAKRRVWLAAAVVLAVSLGGILGGAFWSWPRDRATPEELLAGAKEALAREEFGRAEQLALRLTKRNEHRAEAWLIAGESAVRQGRHDDALRHYEQVPKSAGELFQISLLASGELMLKDRRQLSRAEDFYRRVLEADPRSLVAHDRLAFVLGIQARGFEAAQHRLELIRNNQFTVAHLVLLALGDTAEENPEPVAMFHRETPDDPRALCGPVRAALRENRLAEAREMLLRIVKAEPDLLQAQAWLGSVLAAEGRTEAFLAWNRALPAEAESFPEIWRQRGDWAEAHGERRVAIRCYWEAARLDPNLLPAHHQLSRLLAVEGEAEQAEPFMRRARLLEELVLAARTFQLSRSNDSLAAAADLSERLGNYWEALGWSRLALGQTPPSAESQRNIHRLLEAALEDPTQRTAVVRQSARAVDLSSYPLPKWRGKTESGPRREGASPSSAPIEFADRALAAGVLFAYVNGSREETSSEYMYEFSGGGVAVLDYDGDGWPDLHLTQGCAWPPRPDQREHLDRLYRNLGSGRFAEVAEAARLFENGFSQGVTVGDYDNDGFDDIYVCNIGGNRLFHNNGDGTFTDVTAAAGVAGGRWSTSCLLADLNGDGWPDLYVVNYLAGEHVFDRPCLLPDGSPRLCTPHEYQAAHDQLYLNLGDGRFADVSAAAGIELPEGKGLGVVAADFDGSGRLGLFVANDTVPNFFFRNKTPRAGDPPKFSEEATVAGLAVDGEGRAQANMGVACGDASGDGRLDLYVTTFRNESKTLFVQQAGGLFLDETRRANLREASYGMLGFGTQFLDADLDGLLDLVVTNGHVGDLSQHGIPYQMPTQFFRNVGRGRFEELSAKSLGPFFERKHLGRGLARVDWNRDGLDDFVVSDLKTPAAVLTNQTRAKGHYLALRLRAVNSARDAIGATVTLTSGERRWTAQLTAGDGYFASNERLIRLGLGERDQIDRVEIGWPSGAKQTLASPQVDSELLVIEGREEAVRLMPK